MELRHLRYFVAVAEEGSVKLAAEKRLHTSQPSLSRQIRDLENEVGAQLLRRGARGVELTQAGQAFLDHARVSLSHAKAAIEAAKRAANPAKPIFAVGFVVGHESDCIPPTTDILRDDLPGLEVRVYSGFSVNLAEDLVGGRLDVAFMRREPTDDLAYRHVFNEPLVAILPSDHRLAGHSAIDPRALMGETFIGISHVPRVLRGVVNDYLERSGVRIVPSFEIDNFAMAISLVGSTRGVALLPASIRSYLPPALVSRPMVGEQPTIELVIGFRPESRSPTLGKFLSRLAELRDRVKSSA